MLREIGGRAIGSGARVFTIAEIGLNHGGSVERALTMVDAAAAAGASAIKLQTLVANELVASACPAPAHVNATSLRDFFAGFELDLDAHRTVVARARAHRLAVLSTPFSERAVAMLELLGIDAFKIASGDLTYTGLIAAAARTGRPVILSTGMSTMPEIVEAFAVARAAGADELAALHCVSAYPTPPECQNLRAISTLSDALSIPVGLSDHGTGINAAIAAVALGACIYERHLVLDDDVDAIDRPVSSTPGELGAIIRAMAQTRVALGDGRKVPQPTSVPTSFRAAVACTRGVLCRPVAAWKRAISWRSDRRQIFHRRISPPSSGPRCTATCRPEPLSAQTTWLRINGLHEVTECIDDRRLRRVPLVQAFRHALKALGVEGRVIVTDVNPLSPAVHVADRAYRVPMATDPAYLTELLDICEAERVRLVVPTIDDELPMFGEAREQFRHIGTTVACSPASTSLTCNDKFTTCQQLSEAGVPAAKTYLPTTVPAHAAFPLFVKPRVGRGAVGRVSCPHPRGTALLPWLCGRTDRPGVPRGHGVHHRRALRLRRETAVDRAARARGHSRGHHRSRPHGERPEAHRAGQGCVRCHAVRRADQHSVPDAGQRTGDLRNQSPLLGRHSTDDSSRRRFRPDAADAHTRPQGSTLHR
jgi:N-acetylneuraminate synthase/N,N'-diacetyllegionaminate synthase